MKILYVGTERDEAQAIATAVSGLSDRVSVSWTSGLDQVAKWIDENHGLRALVVEAQPNGPVWRSVLTYAAKLPTALPVVVIEPEGTASHLQPLVLDAHECIARNSSLLRDLPAAITRAIDRARRRQPSQQMSSLPRPARPPDRTAPDIEHNSPPTAFGAVHEQGQRLEELENLVELERAERADLEQKLVRATASIQEAEHRHQTAIAAAAQQVAIGQSHYEVGMARAAAMRDMVDEQFREAAIEVERVRRSHASAIADAERLARREAELAALLDAATTTRGVLEHRLADAETALRVGEARTAEELRTAADLFAERQREFHRKISEEIDKRRTLQDTLTHALGAGDAAEERHASAITAAAAQSRELQAALSAAREELEQKAAHLDALVTREAELTSMLAAATTSRETIERRLAATEAALREADARATRDLLAAGKRAAEREAELEEQIGQERAARTTLEEEIAEAGAALDETRREQRSAAADVARLTEREAGLTSELGDAQAALRDERQRHDAALATAAGKLAERQAHFGHERVQAEAERAGLTAQLREVEEARDQARREHQSTVADLTRLTEREAELEARLEEERATRDAIQQAVGDAQAALRDEQQRHDVALATAAGKLAERQAHFGHERVQAEAERAGLTAQLREVEEARDQARREHQSTVADLTRLTEREAELEARLEEERATRDAIQQAVGDAQAALRDQQQRHDAALATAAGKLAERQAHFGHELAQAQGERAGLSAQLREVEEARVQAQREHQSAVADLTRLTEREAELEARLEEERATRDAFEQALADAQAALRDEQQRHDAALATAAGELTERQAHFDHERAQAQGERAGLTAQLREVEEARVQAQREHQSAVADLTRLTEREADLTSELADVQAVRCTLELHLTEAVRASSDAAERAAAEREAAAACQADLEARLLRADETIDGLQQALAGTRSAALDAERLLNEETNTLRADALVQAAQFGDRFDEQRRQYEGRLAEAEDINNTLARERVALQESLHTTQKESHRLDREHRAERERLAQAHAAASAAIQQLTAERQEIERRFEEARSGFQDSLDRLTLEHAAALATREGDIEQSRISLTARLEELEATKRQRDVLQADADQLPGLHQELHQSRADNHRLFQQAQLPMFRCTKDGALTQANRLLTIFLGRRSPNELREADFAAAVFESPNDLSWLIERCLGSRGKEWIETTWRRKDGSRLLVRVSACATSSDLIECGVEDLTAVRMLEDRLSQAHRMEAVGRLAAEVAVTCGNVLRGIHQNAQQWLMTDGNDSASRQRGEMLLEEVSRAGGLLRQLAAYGDEENRRPAVVDLSTVVRDIAPVLKCVAGDAVDVQLPAASAQLNVDAGAERVQRLLVNLAAYGRERMPFGGRLKIELGTIVVDRHFTAKHPNVRLGPHALVTVTESRRTTRMGGLLQLHDHEAGPGSQGSVAVQTSVDVGTLQELVGECGGHLWMTVQPLGDMVVKIRLPLLTSYGHPPRRALTPAGRVRTIAHWFQH